MGNTVLLIGDINVFSVQDKIVEIVNDFLNDTLTFDEIRRLDYLFYLTSIDDKINVDMVNDYRDFFSYTQTDSDFKIGIFNDFDLVSVSNQNKLLKCIEDNNENALQIFIVKSEAQILTTIKSRLLTFDLRDNIKLSYPLENDFYKTCVKTQSEINYLVENDAIYKALLSIYNYLINEEYNNAFIIFGKPIFKHIDKTSADIMFRIIVNSQLQLNKVSKALEIAKLEKRIYANLDVNLQIEALLIRLTRS